MIMAQLPRESLEYTVNHFVLPPKLPQEEENSNIVQQAESNLLHFLSIQVDLYRCQRLRDEGSSTNVSDTWTTIHSMLSCPSLRPAQSFSTE